MWFCLVISYPLRGFFSEIIPPPGETTYDLFHIFRTTPGGRLPGGEGKRTLPPPQHTRAHILEQEIDTIYASFREKGLEGSKKRRTHAGSLAPGVSRSSNTKKSMGLIPKEYLEMLFKLRRLEVVGTKRTKTGKFQRVDLQPVDLRTKYFRNDFSTTMLDATIVPDATTPSEMIE